MQKGWVAKCDASPLGLFSFQSAKQNPNFFSRKYKDFLPLKTDAMIIKQMQKSSRYSTRFMLKSHACRWIEGCTKMRRKNCKFGDSKRGMHVLFLKKSFHLFVKIRKKKFSLTLVRAWLEL